jgi:hypothetical protein
MVQCSCNSVKKANVRNKSRNSVSNRGECKISSKDVQQHETRGVQQQKGQQKKKERTRPRSSGSGGLNLLECDVAVRRDLVLQALDLAGGEVIEAGVVRVVHEVVYQIQPQVSKKRNMARVGTRTDRVDEVVTWAGVTADGAARRGLLFRSGVRHTVADGAAATLEGVVQSNPVLKKS